MRIGCHVSIAGGVPNAPSNAAVLGCEVFQIFSRSPRGGPALTLTKEIIDHFWREMKKHNLSEFVIHTPYFINFGSSNKRIYHGSISIIREELDRATALDCKYVMTHLGSYKDLGREKGFKQFIAGLEKIMKGYSGSARLLLEISAGAGEQIGGTFEEIGKAVNHPKLKKYNIGVCFDTCHAFASGYDLRTPQAVKKTFTEFDKKIGFSKLKVLHINDSKAGIGENKDRHEHIGRGKIGKAGIEAVLNYSRLKDIDVYLETKHDAVKKDIEILQGLRK